MQRKLGWYWRAVGVGVVCLLFHLGHGRTAGAEWHLSGSFRTDVVMRGFEAPSSTGGVAIRLRLTGGSQGAARAVIAIENPVARRTTSLDGDFSNDVFSVSTPLRLNMTAARIELLGPLWPNGPSMRTRLGRFTVHYSDWVARSVGRTGVELQGFTLGPIRARLYHGLPQGWTAVRAELGDYRATAYAVTLSRQAEWEERRVVDYELYGRLGSNRGSYLALTYAFDGEAEAAAARLEGRVRSGSRTDISLSTWAASDAFAPPRARRNREGETVAFTAGRMGVEWAGVFRSSAGEWEGVWRKEYALAGEPLGQQVSIRTSRAFGQQAGYITGEVRNGYPGGSVRRFVTLGWEAGSDARWELLRGFDSKLGAAWQLHWSGGAMVGSQPVKVSLDVWHIHQRLYVGGDVQWQAPNGIGFGVHYASYPRYGVDEEGAWPQRGEGDGLRFTASVERRF